MIIHIDMDAFFASVEQMDNPDLRGRPVIVGGSSDRGVVSTCSYEARTFGVHSAMPMVVARRLCPQAVIVRGRYQRYAELSHAIMSALKDFSPLVEPASVDEAYMDATGLERLFGPLEELVAGIKTRIVDVTGGLTCSVGAAPVKFLAKICSDVNKPDGVFILRQENMDAFLCALPVGRIPGVGKRTVQSLQDLGVRTVAQLRRFSPDFMERRFGKWGLALYERAQGRDSRKVETEREAKSESAECTFAEDTRDRDFLQRMLMAHAERVGSSLRRHGYRGRTITLKVKFCDFRQITRSRTHWKKPSVLRKPFLKQAAACWQNCPCRSPCALSALACRALTRPPASFFCRALARPQGRSSIRRWKPKGRNLTPRWTACAKNSANRLSSAGGCLLWPASRTRRSASTTARVMVWNNRRKTTAEKIRKKRHKAFCGGLVAAQDARPQAAHTKTVRALQPPAESMAFYLWARMYTLKGKARTFRCLTAQIHGACTATTGGRASSCQNICT